MADRRVPAALDRSSEASPAERSVAPAVDAPAPPTLSPAGLLALQQGAGNAAVARMLAARDGLLQRDETDIATADPPARPLPSGFEWIGSPEAPQLLIERAHLERFGIARGTLLIEAASNPALFRPLIAALLDRYPWTAPRRDTILEELKFSLELSAEQWEKPQMEVPLKRGVFKVIGLPPDAPVQVYFVGGGIEIYVDLATLNPTGGDPGAAIPERVLQKLEEAVRMPVPAERRAVIAASIQEFLTPLSGVAEVPLPEAWMLEVFGEKAWRERLEASEDSVQGGTVLSGGPGTFELSPLLSKEDEQFVKETIEKLFGKAKGGKASRVPLRVFTSDVEALRRLAKDPERLERLAALLYFGDQGESARHTSFADLLETADEALDIQENARRLGVKLGSGPPDQEPIDRRPVRGDIVNKTGELVPKQEAHFEFETRDKIDAFRVPMVNVRWVAVEKGKGGARIDSERNRYIEIRPDGIINDRVFEVTFPRKGVYEVHAFVDHNFYLPGHFVSAVEVRTEQERLKTMDERSGFGRVTGSAPKRFKDVEEEEGDVSVAAGLFGAPIDLLSPPGRKSDYAAGRRMTGVIDPDVMAVEGGGVAIGLTGLDEEIRQVEQLRKDTEKAGGEDKAAMLKWIDDRLEGLRGTHKKLTKAKDEPGTRSVLTQGSYVARTNKVRGGPLTLVSWFTHDPATGTYHAHLLDHSQLVRAEDFHFQAKGTKYEEVMERLFFELTKTYPDGSMTFAFQKFDGVEPTDRFVRFERKTDTALNDVRDVLYSEEASLAVSIFSLLLMIFPPTALAGITIGVVYNTAQALDSYAEAERTGTLKTSHKIELALAALSVLPAARGANIVRLGGRTYRVISVVERAGEVFLLAQSAEGEIRNLRDSQITDLAKLHDEIQRRKRVNASDEDLRKLEYRADRLRDEIRNASLTVLEQMGKSQLLQMAPGAAINAFAARRRGGADADVDDPARRPQPDDPAGTTDPAKRGAALGDPVLAEGLPAGLRRQVAVERDESVHDSTVRVHYDLDDNGLVRSVTVKAGRSATPDDIRLHARTVELMLGYRGLSGTVRDLLGRVKAFFTGDAPPPPVGSRAWEAKLEIDKLPRVIKSRMKALESGADEATAAKLRAEIAFLDEQLARHKDTFDRLDLEAGAGFVAAEKDHHAKAVAAGYPSLDKAEGHFYEPDGKGGYALRQRADSAAPPLELSEEGGKRTLRKGSREPIPGLDLDQTELRRVLEVMSAGQATALAEVFSPAAVQKLARGGADGLRQALRAHERIVPLLSDPAAAAGVERLARGGKMGIDKILTAFNDVPETNLRDLMRVLGDEKWTHHPHSMGAAKIVALGRRTTELRFIARFGIDVYNELRTDKKTYGKMLATLPDLDDVAAEKLVRDMLDAGTPLAREQIEVLKIKPRPKPRRTSRYARADTSDEAGWPEYLEKARKWMTEERAKHLTPRDGKVDVEAAIEAHAAIEQIKDKVNSRWEAYQKLPYEARVRFLEDIDDIGRQGGLYNTWVSNARGAVAERLFAPGGGLNQKRIENPLHPAIDKQGKETTGYTRLDGFYEPGRRKGSTSGQKEWVEVKSDEIGMPGRDGKPNAAAVATARRYAADGLQDWHALLAHQSTREDGIVIQFAKKPADEATKQAMLKELFATNSPFAAVGFGDEWHERPAGRALPPKPPELEDGPIRGVPAGAAAGG